MSRFIEDLIPLILDCHEHWWNRDLTRLALVSPGWLYHVQKRLYTFPSLYSFPACSSLARTLETNPYLGSLVQHLALLPICDSARKTSSQDRMAVRTLLGLQGLRSLSLGGELAVQSERFLGFVSASETLRQLHINGGSLRTSLASQASLEWNDDVAFRFPNLKVLRLTDLEMEINSISRPPVEEMEELVVENVVIISGFLSHLIPEGSVVRRLCVKASRACEYNEQVRMMLFSLNVHSLEYELEQASLTDGTFLEPVDGIVDGHALQLCHLELHGLYVDIGVIELIGRWCPKIEELVITGRMVRFTEEEWERYICSGGMRKLKGLKRIL